MGWRSVLHRLRSWRALRDIAGLSGSTLLYQVLYLLRGIVAARVLGPELMGVWAAGYILNMYLTNSHLGTLSAMRREMTIARGQKDLDRVESLRRAGFTLAVIPCVLAGLGVVAWVMLSWEQMSETYRCVLLLITVLALLQQLGLFLSFCLFSEGRFVETSRANIVMAVLFVATVPLIWWFGLAGFAIGFVVSQLAGLSVFVWAAGFPRRFSSDWKLLGFLLKEGLPFLGVNIVYTVQTSIDRIVVLDFYGERYLGLYSLALQALSLANVIVGSISQVSYSKMGIRYGETNDPEALYTHGRRLPPLLAWSVMPLLVLAALIVEPFVHLVLPDYAEAIWAVRLVCLQGFFMALAIVPSSFLSTIRRNWVYIAIQLIATALTWSCCVASAHLESGLEGITLANGLATASYVLMLYGAAAYFGRQPLAALLPFLLGLGIPLVLGTGLVAGILWAAFQPTVWSLGTAALLAVVGMLGTLFVARRAGVLALWQGN